MKIIVTDAGFARDNWTSGFVPIDAVTANDAGSDFGIDMAADNAPRGLADMLPKVAIIRIDFPTFTDGRGFTLAAQFRRMGYLGRLRARGQIIADQYAMARRAGFDEVEITPELAARQPEPQWLARADWRAHDYQTRLRGGPEATQIATRTAIKA
ncbi:MAG: DUF934 domain-containing protein [Octadecabacter sp.]|nr:DUF934 domain-containing protein [Octadecabacter sp.]